MTDAIRFRFDFADLEPPAVELRIIDGGVEVPAHATRREPAPRPRWLGRLLPIFPEGRGLRVSVSLVAAPTFGAVLLDALGGLYAAAAANSGAGVTEWDGDFLVGSHGMSRMPLEAHVNLVAADLAATSLEKATTYLGLLPPERTVLVLNGNLRRLERRLPLAAAAVVWRLPMLGRRELSAIAGGMPASLGSRRFGRACLDLAKELARRYREQLH